MKFAFFHVFSIQSGDEERELNQFLASHRIVQVNREFVNHGQDSFWSFCIGYVEGAGAAVEKRRRNRIDYKDVLSADEFARFVKLREWRKKTAAEEGVPVYAIFTNEQMAEIAQKDRIRLDDLKLIDGVGDTRLKKYGKSVLDILNNKEDALETDPD